MKTLALIFNRLELVFLFITHLCFISVYTIQAKELFFFNFITRNSTHLYESQQILSQELKLNRNNKCHILCSIKLGSKNLFCDTRKASPHFVDILFHKIPREHHHVLLLNTNLNAHICSPQGPHSQDAARSAGRLTAKLCVNCTKKK